MFCKEYRANINAEQPGLGGCCSQIKAFHYITVIYIYTIVIYNIILFVDFVQMVGCINGCIALIPPLVNTVHKIITNSMSMDLQCLGS